MGCGGSKEGEVAAPSAAPKKTVIDDQEVKDTLEAQKKFKEKQAKLERDREEQVKKEKENKEAEQKAKENADAAEKEKNEAAAEAIANDMAADLAQKKLEEARLAEAAAKEEEEKQLLESFKGMGAKLRLRNALASGKIDVARDAAASVIQGAVRVRISRKKVIAKRAEKIALLKEGSARKIQSRYRSRLARRRVAEKREEKKRILAEEAERRALFEAQMNNQSNIKSDEPETVSVADVAVVITPVVPTAPAMKTGNIKKEGQVIKTWKSRHFVLRNIGKVSRLTYYVSPKATEPFGEDEKGSIDLDGAVVKDIAGLNLSCVDTEGRDLKLAFENAADKESWRRAIEEHIAFSARK